MDLNIGSPLWSLPTWRHVMSLPGECVGLLVGQVWGAVALPSPWFVANTIRPTSSHADCTLPLEYPL